MEDPTFTVEATPSTPDAPLVVAAADPGMVGLTAADHLVTERDAEQVGHVAVDGLPVTAPVVGGEPRHHSRVYATDGVTVLLTELFLPLAARTALADAVADWATANASEVVVLNAVPFPHAPEDHDVFTVTTPDYDERHPRTELRPLNGGLLDGLAGELLTATLEDRLPPAAALVTPAHPPGPDVDAAILLLDALESVYGFGVDSDRLTELSERIQTYYAELAERAREMAGEGPREYPYDRTYM